MRVVARCAMVSTTGHGPAGNGGVRRVGWRAGRCRSTATRALSPRVWHGGNPAFPAIPACDPPSPMLPRHYLSWLIAISTARPSNPHRGMTQRKGAGCAGFS